MKTSPLQRLVELGQSVWLDYIRRDLVEGPELGRLIQEDGLRGMTSNPTIFDHAISQTTLYDEAIRRLAGGRLDEAQVFDALAVEDVRRAADAFRSLHEATGGHDGFVSIEVNPRLARDTRASADEARRLWRACDRPNVMVKIPGTAEGLPAIRQCLAEGININVTLLFSVERYRAVAEAYVSALQARVAAGEPVDRLRSVASFFVSRVDTNVDAKLDRIAGDPGRPERERRAARELRGRAAIANARLAYQAFQELFRGERFRALHERGAAVQRPLWASTSTKDPAYPDLYYVEALVAPGTVDTMPRDTLDAYRDHGDPSVRIYDELAAAPRLFRRLAELGLHFEQVTQELEDEGVRKFADSYADVVRAVGRKREALRAA